MKLVNLNVTAVVLSLELAVSCVVNGFTLKGLERKKSNEENAGFF